MDFVEKCIDIDRISRESLMEKMQLLTSLSNPNSVVQMKEWLSDNGVETETLGKKAVAALIDEVPDEMSEVLSLRQKLAKSSVRKYQAMQNSVCRWQSERNVPVLRCQPHRAIRRKTRSVAEPATEPYGRLGRGKRSG